MDPVIGYITKRKATRGNTISWWRYTHPIKAKALGDIARAKGMTQVARDAGLSRESLYKALLKERIPDFDTVLNVIMVIGLKLPAEAV